MGAFLIAVCLNFYSCICPGAPVHMAETRGPASRHTCPKATCFVSLCASCNSGPDFHLSKSKVAFEIGRVGDGAWNLQVQWAVLHFEGRAHTSLLVLFDEPQGWSWLKPLLTALPGLGSTLDAVPCKESVDTLLCSVCC